MGISGYGPENNCSKDPQNGDAFYDLGKALALAGDTAAAVGALERSIQLKPADPSPHYQLARTLEKMGKREEAIEQFKLIYEVDSAYRDVAARVDAFYAGG